MRKLDCTWSVIVGHGRIESQGIELGTLCAWAQFDVSEALPIGQL